MSNPFLLTLGECSSTIYLIYVMIGLDSNLHIQSFIYIKVNCWKLNNQPEIKNLYIRILNDSFMKDGLGAAMIQHNKIEMLTFPQAYPKVIEYNYEFLVILTVISNSVQSHNFVLLVLFHQRSIITKMASFQKILLSALTDEELISH